MNVRLARLCSTLLPLTLCGCQCSSDGEETDASPVDSGEEDAGADGGSDACVWPEQPECPDVEIQPIDPACSKDGWCWVHPTPAGNGYRTLWDDGCTLYAGGEEGALAAVDLATGELSGFWNLFDDGTIDEMTGLADGRLVFLVFYQTWQGLYSWDGENVEEWPMPEGDYELTLKDVEVDLNGDLYVTGEDYDEANQSWHGYFARWDGAGWERIETGLEHGLHEMAVEPCGGMYILAGRSHTLDDYPGGCGVFYWNGEELVQEHWRSADWHGDPCVLMDIDVGEDEDVWAGGDYGYLIHRLADGSWQVVQPNVEIPMPSGATNPFWLGMRIEGVAVESADSVVVGGTPGGAVGWDGEQWRVLWYQDDKTVGFSDVHFAGERFWGVRSCLYELFPEEAKVVKKIGGEDVSINGVWVSSTGKVFLIGIKGLENPNKPAIMKLSASNKIEEMSLPNMQVEWLWNIWGLNDDDIWAVGPDGTVLHYDGAAWELQASPVTGDLRAMWGASSNDIYFVGDDSAIVHWNGLELTEVEAPTEGKGYMDILGFDADNIYIIMGAGGVIHYDGLEWKVVVQPIYDGFFEIAGKSPNEMYISASSSVYFFDGVNLVNEQVGPYGEFESLAVDPGSRDVYVTCGTASLGKVLRLTDGEWVLEDTGTFSPLVYIIFGYNEGFVAAGGLLSKQLD
jgi:hypothetical protein